MKKKVVGYLALIPSHHGGGTAPDCPARGVNGTVFVHTKRENIEKCEVTMV